jgi:hypothetical protein
MPIAKKVEDKMLLKTETMSSKIMGCHSYNDPFGFEKFGERVCGMGGCISDFKDCLQQ